jgi:hypothetical protein
MHRYDNKWPIDAYAHMWRRYTRWKPTRVALEDKTSSVIPSNSLLSQSTRLGQCHSRGKRAPAGNEADHASASRNQIIEFVGKPPPCVNSKDAWKSGISARQNSPPRTLPSASKGENRNVQAVNQPETDPDHTIIYLSPCAICGYLPPISEDIRVGIRKLFSDVPHVIQNLSQSGLVHDRHLALLASLDKRNKQEFCDRLPRNLFSALELFAITNRLMDFSLNSGPPAPQGPCDVLKRHTELEWPDAATKILLQESPNILSVLRRTMGLQFRPALFLRITVCRSLMVQYAINCVK